MNCKNTISEDLSYEVPKKQLSSYAKNYTFLENGNINNRKLIYTNDYLHTQRIVSMCDNSDLLVVHETFRKPRSSFVKKNNILLMDFDLNVVDTIYQSSYQSTIDCDVVIQGAMLSPDDTKLYVYQNYGPINTGKSVGNNPKGRCFILDFKTKEIVDVFENTIFKTQLQYAFSPDMKRFVYLNYSDNRKKEHIYVFDTETKKSELIVENARHAKWSPTQGQIAYVKLQEKKNGDKLEQLHLINPETQEIKTIYTCKEGEWGIKIKWLPDGEHLVVRTNNNPLLFGKRESYIYTKMKGMRGKQFVIRISDGKKLKSQGLVDIYDDVLWK